MHYITASIIKCTLTFNPHFPKIT